MSKYSETMGSFSRTGNYPLEANYIFPTEEALKEFYNDELNATTLHKGLLKIVENDGNDKQALYWVTSVNNVLTFTKLASGNVTEILDNLSKKLDKEISDRTNMDTAIYGVKDPMALPTDRNSILALSNAIDDLKSKVVTTITPKNQDVIDLAVTKNGNTYEISAELDLSNETGNQLIKKGDGAYLKINSIYEGGVLTLFANDRLVSQHSLGSSTIISSATYDSVNKQIVIVFKLTSGETTTVNIPVGDLIKDWGVDNSSVSKVVELTKDTTGDTDKLSGDVRLWSDKKNILKKYNNTIGVDGSSTSITHNGKTLDQVIADIETEIANVSTGLFIYEVE